VRNVSTYIPDTRRKSDEVQTSRSGRRKRLKLERLGVDESKRRRRIVRGRGDDGRRKKRGANSEMDEEKGG